MIIAVDGPAGAGKSTIAKRVARELGILYIDTGAMYRAVTLKVLNEGIDIADSERVTDAARRSAIDLRSAPDGSLTVMLDGTDVSALIREPRVSARVSDVARIKGVREVMVGLQRSVGQKHDCILDGRDIGTVVFPSADKKFYLDADFNERVNRRFEEFRGVHQVSVTDVEADLRNRDTIDSTRECSPLRKADDAVYVDTTNMSIDEVVSALLKEIKK